MSHCDDCGFQTLLFFGVPERAFYCAQEEEKGGK